MPTLVEEAAPAAVPQSWPDPERAVAVLAISPHEDDHRRLGHIFSHSNWHVNGARTWSDAKAQLSNRVTPVVICEASLADATWHDVLETLDRLEDAPLLIVTSRAVDDGVWAEVLNLGGFDVLMKPLDPAEVIRVVSLAWLNWKRRRAVRWRTEPPGL